MGGQTLLWTATAVGAISIAGCLLAIAHIFAEINNLHDDVMQEMAEFQIYANDAWDEMIEMSRGSAFASFQSTFRVRRQPRGYAPPPYPPPPPTCSQ